MTNKQDRFGVIGFTNVWRDLAIIFLVWGASLAIVNPIGNFPLNDDWAFASTVRHLLEYGEYRPTGWASMPLITNVLWGSLFCLPAGISFDVLRLSTIVASLAGLGGFYLFLRELRQPGWMAIIAALTLGFNPVYYSLSNTFMTDVLYTALQLFAAFFFVRNLRTDSYADLLIATLLALAATLSRQLAIAVPLAFAVTVIFRRGINVRSVLSALVPIATCVGALLAFQRWLAMTGRLQPLYSANNDFLLQMLGSPKLLLMSLVANSIMASIYLGLFLLPILLITVGNVWRVDKWKTTVNLLIAGAVAVGGAGLLRGSAFQMPTMGNIFIKYGIGPLTLRDTHLLNLDYLLPALPDGLWLVVTIASLLGAAMLLVATLGVIGKISNLRAPERSDSEVAGAFLLLATAIYLGPLLATIPCDRYFIPVLPLLIGGILCVFSRSVQWDKAFRYAAIVVIVASSIFSIFATKDYFSWNRARWAALADLQNNYNASVDDIDGGLEFNGLYAYDPEYQRTEGKSWWWVKGDRYLIGFQPVFGYKVLKGFEYSHWLPRYTGRIVILEKDTSQSPSTDWLK